jgi:hypothetical protein
VPGTVILSGGMGEQNLPVPTADQTPERRNRSVDIAISKQALMSDLDYCQALSVTYRRYRPSLCRRGGGPCNGHLPDRSGLGHSVLEDHITTMRVPLPSRVLVRS